MECFGGFFCGLLTLLLKEALKKWLDQKSQVDILDWFDCIEVTRARRDGARLTLKTELTARDKLFLSLLMTPAKVDLTTSNTDRGAKTSD